MNKSARIVANSFFLYLRMFIVMALTLYTVRISLKILGVQDFGIYDAVAQIVTSLSFLSGVLSSATQRFYSFSIGENNTTKLKDIFKTSLVIYVSLAIVIFIFGETIGLWFLNKYLVIPNDRMNAANWIYQFSIFSFISAILSIPYSSAILAHENMKVFSIITVISAFIKLICVFIIPYLSFDYLIIYGAFLLLIQILTLSIYIIISKKYYKECRGNLFSIRTKDYSLYKEILSFSGWSLFGSLARVGNNQGNAILINVFFTSFVNAARAIAFQVSIALLTFCNSFVMAIRPPLVKSYAEKDWGYMMKLFYFSNKFIYYCMLIIILPLYLEMEFILKIWLTNVTEHMIIFTQLSIIYTLILSMHYPITILIQATGDVKKYFLRVESFTILCLPLTYIAFHWGFKPESTFIVTIVVFFIAHLIRINVLSMNLPYFYIKDYIIKFCIPAILITFIALLTSYSLTFLIDSGWQQFITVTFSSITTILILILLLAINKEEKTFIKKYINGFKIKIL